MTDISAALKYLEEEGDEPDPDADEGAAETDDDDGDEATPEDDTLDVVLVSDAERVQDALKSGSPEDVARALLAFIRSAE